MKASELIAQLQALVEEHGDLEVAVYDPEGASLAVQVFRRNGILYERPDPTTHFLIE